jgi:hypothetical protein
MGPSQPPLFIVSTGRCGSTMLSELLALHPAVLSISELFNALAPFAFNKRSANGATFWHVLSAPRRRHTVWLELMRAGLVIDEFRYPGKAAGRFAKTGIPPLLAMTLPPLTDDPDGLHEELRAFVEALPEDLLSAHYLRVFEWLKARLGRRFHCERSGASLGYVHALMHVFPTARFVHVFRDGREASRSASRFLPMRLGALGRIFREAIGKNPFDEPFSPDPARVPEALRGLLPRGFDVEAFKSLDIPIERFGKGWSEMVTKGTAALEKLPPERLLNVSYESVLAAPEAELRRLVRFMDPGLDDPTWMREAVSRVRPNPPTWQTLPEAQRSRLEAACAPGMKSLERLL